MTARVTIFIVAGNQVEIILYGQGGLERIRQFPAIFPPQSSSFARDSFKVPAKNFCRHFFKQTNASSRLSTLVRYAFIRYMDIKIRFFTSEGLLKIPVGGH